ncbi:pyroglutamylated RF-amide peptide receptor isoform X1 [Orcinus orca]|uniref:pyroglutamylated RF-amide peptide receptor isoform X1 n=1 Tax=Orcinus orca TaxID=9733 RepID=UPI002112353E|nr:pyroglutamylated RF-amide peptide receptor isoform X1 [Orcinus orca]
MQSLNITPEQFSRLLRDHNPTRAQFIALYGLRPLVYTPQLPGRAKLAFVLTGVLIFVLALFGNALVVYVVTLSEAMRTVTNIFTCSLALSDLPISFCIPVTMLENIFNNWLGASDNDYISALLAFQLSSSFQSVPFFMGCFCQQISPSNFRRERFTNSERPIEEAGPCFPWCSFHSQQIRIRFSWLFPAQDLS